MSFLVAWTMMENDEKADWKKLLYLILCYEAVVLIV